MKKNQYGLSRHIPEPIKRIIRQRCGFGCVICGNGFYTYEHFEPEFRYAKLHNPSGMTLLCWEHQMKKKNGWISKDDVVRANKNPKCNQKGFAKHLFNLGNVSPKILFAGVTFQDCDVLIKVNNSPILSISKPETLLIPSPYRLSGLFRDPQGKLALKIDKNELFVYSDN
jgi:hypothetical protein